MKRRDFFKRMGAVMLIAVTNPFDLVPQAQAYQKFGANSVYLDGIAQGGWVDQFRVTPDNLNWDQNFEPPEFLLHFAPHDGEWHHVQANRHGVQYSAWVKRFLRG